MDSIHTDCYKCYERNNKDLWQKVLSMTYLGFGDQGSLCEVGISALTKETMTECQ